MLPFDAIAAELRAALTDIADDLSWSGLRGAALCRSLEREARPVLERARRAGRVTRFAVRCSIEDSPEGRRPVTEIALWLPGRVRELVLHITPSTPV